MAQFSVVSRVSATALALMLALPAWAQDSSPVDPQSSSDASGGLTDIVVTARRVSENLQSVPIAVTAASGEQLRAQNTSRVDDLSRIAPGLAFKETATNSVAITVSLRGQFQSDSAAAVDPSVGVYVDGLYWARAFGLNADLVDLQSVQVLKGPQGTLFGRNTPGGAVVFQTNDPDPGAFSGLVSATYGRFDELGANVVLNVPIVQDRVAIRGAFSRSTRDGYARDTATGARYDDRDSWTGRLKLLLRPSDNFSLLLSAEMFKNDTATPYRQLAYVFPGSRAESEAGGAAAAAAYLDSIAGHPNQVRLNESPLNDTKTQTYSATGTLDTSFGAVKLIAGYRDTDGLQTLDIDGSPFPIHRTTTLQDLRQKSVELQVTGKALNDSIDFAAGALYFREEGSDSSQSTTAPSFSPFTSRFAVDLDYNSYGIYGQATAHLTDAFSITGGLRYAIDDKHLTTHNLLITRATGAIACQVAGTTTPAPDCALGRSDTFRSLSYLISADYKFTDDIMLYIKRSRGARAGGVNRIFPSAAAFLPFEDETNTEHEIGLKSQFFDRRLRVNLAAYHSSVRNLQRTSLIVLPTGGSGTLTVNAGKARFMGFEADVSALLFEGFQVGGNMSLIDSKYIRFSDLSGDRRQERFAYVPKTSFSVSAAYEHDLDFGTLKLRTDYAWQGRMALDPFNNPANPLNDILIAKTTKPAGGYLGARASLSFLDNALEVALFGRNLNNNRDPVNAFIVAAPTGYVQNGYPAPRTFGVNVTYRFGSY